MIRLLISRLHKKVVRDFYIRKNQFHDIIKIRSNQKKNAKKIRFNREIRFREFVFEDLIFLYQKKIEKLKPK